MGRRGPQPQPAAIKQAKGNPGRRRITDEGEDGKAVKPGALKAPPWCKGRAGRFFKQLSPSLVRMRLMKSTDVTAFARYCLNLDRWLRVQEEVDKADKRAQIFYETETGYLRPHPGLLVAPRLESLLERAEDRFGLNPAERQRILMQQANVGNVGLFSDVSSPSAQEAKQKPVGASSSEDPFGCLTSPTVN